MKSENGAVFVKAYQDIVDLVSLNSISLKMGLLQRFNLTAWVPTIYRASRVDPNVAGVS